MDWTAIDLASGLRTQLKGSILRLVLHSSSKPFIQISGYRELLRKADKLKLLRLWREHYANALQAETGSDIAKSWDPYVFEKGLFPCVQDHEAEKEYAQLPPEPCYVIPSDSGAGFWCSSLPPSDLNRDH